MLRIETLATHLIGPVSLTVEAGECVAIMGPSGSGKSLFLRAIADLDPNRGRVSLDGRDRNTMPAPHWRRQVMLVPAESGWWADEVRAHFPAGAEVAPMLQALGLAQAFDWPVSRLSTGERQRLSIARALCHAPAALLLDEPTAALDAQATAQFETLIREWRATGTPVILVTHDPAQAGRLADRTLRMQAGQLHRETATA